MVIDKNEFFNNFKRAKSRYKELQDVSITLRFGKSPFFTMQALLEPISLFQKKKKYFVLINLKRTDFLSQLSEDNILGWFGHELAHIVEYEKLTNLNLFVFAVKYLFDSKFRYFVERSTNAFAFNNGFALELFLVWKKFISMDIKDINYKKYILENYCPHWADIKETAQNFGISKQIYESMKQTKVVNFKTTAKIKNKIKSK